MDRQLSVRAAAAIAHAIALVSAPAQALERDEAARVALRAPGRTSIGFGFGPMAIFGGGLSLRWGVVLNQNVILESDVFVGAWFDGRGVTSESTGLALRLFLRDTLGLRLGARGRHAVAGATPEAVALSTTDVGPSIGLGHRWDYQTGYFSVEWFDLYVPVAALRASSPPFGRVPEAVVGYVSVGAAF